MATIRDLKKIINYELSGVIEECYLWQLVNADKADKAEVVIDKAIETFDSLIEKVNDRTVDNKKAHFRAIQDDLYSTSEKLIAELGAL
jgi:hypothetical protein